ncbi:MAG TPA: TadE/TadG family type IV pilus assembly protein [Dongiaceae bacterium]|nr:TadE/TadG family type IV pilus assembly protein [Dongiaceae bacterium]
MLNRIRKLRRNDRGVAAIEFALLLPLLITLMIGSLEVTFKIWATQKAEKLSVTLADVIAQSQEVTTSDLNSLVSAVNRIMEPFPFGSDGAVIISSVYQPVPEEGDELGEPIVNWQRKFPQSGGLEVESKIGDQGEDAALPNGFDMYEKENCIVAEVYYKYTPIMPGMLFDESVVYRRSFFKPRLGALTDNPS